MKVIYSVEIMSLKLVAKLAIIPKFCTIFEEILKYLLHIE